MTRVLITGGAGFIGSHTCVALAEAGLEPVVFDNFSNSTPTVLNRIETLINSNVPVVESNVLNTDDVRRAIRDYDCNSVIHFAGLKSVGESVEEPLTYYRENVAGAVSLFEAMRAENIKRLIFSSSATVYGVPQALPITEDHPVSTINPYGRSKLIIENILADLHVSDPSWDIVMLRYFNPCGAHESGLIGEAPKGRPNNLMPYIAQVAAGHRTHLNVWGSDYDTPDGTGVRDYIHVVDLAKGHVAALELLDRLPGNYTINLGTGNGYSVLQMIEAFSKASGRDIPYKVAARRQGDVASCFADTKLAQELLGWRAEHGIDRMCQDHWRWQKSGLT